MLESELRQHDAKWIRNARATRVEAGRLFATELDALGKDHREHEVPFKPSMTLPPFQGVGAVAALPELCNPSGFVLIDEPQRSRAYRNSFSAGVCVAIPPVEATPVPTGAAFVALPQIPPRNVAWFKKGKWVHLAKIAIEKYFLSKMKSGNSEPVYEKVVLKAMGIERLAGE